MSDPFFLEGVCSYNCTSYNEIYKYIQCTSKMDRLKFFFHKNQILFLSNLKYYWLQVQGCKTCRIFSKANPVGFISFLDYAHLFSYLEQKRRSNLQYLFYKDKRTQLSVHI